MLGLTRRTLAVAASLCFASVAGAQVTFTGSTTGCFYPAGPACVAVPAQVYKGLSFSGSSFSGNTSTSGDLGFGNAFANNFGTITLSGVPASYANDFFKLIISFTAPTITSTVYTATLTGSVSVDPLAGPSGGVHFDFDNTPQIFTYATTSGTNSFKLIVDDQSIGFNAGPVQLSGFITTAPEPSTVMLVGTGLLGLIPVARRRRKA